MLTHSITRFGSMVALVALLAGTSFGNVPVWDIADEDYGSDAGKSAGIGLTGSIFDSPSTYGGFFSRAGHETVNPDSVTIAGPDGFHGQIHSPGSLSLPGAFRLEWEMGFTHPVPGDATLNFIVSLPGTSTLSLTWHAPGDFGVQLYSQALGGNAAFSANYSYGTMHTYILEVDTDNGPGADYARLWIDTPATNPATAELTGNLDSPDGSEIIQFSMQRTGIAPPVYTTEIDYFRAATIPFIPEPATAGLVMLGAATMIWRRRR